MNDPAFSLIVNTSFALLVAAAFLALSRSAVRPGVIWFAASYAIGAGRPFSALLARVTSFPNLFAFTGFASFSLAVHLVAMGLSRYYGIVLPRLLLPSCFLASLALRIVALDPPGAAALYELPSQLPVAMTLAVCTVITGRHSPARWTDRILTILFPLIALAFLVTPSLSDVVGSIHDGGGHPIPVLQSITAILLVALAFALVLLIVSDTLEAARRRADMDELSGLANRRAFDHGGAELLDRQHASGAACSVVMFDLDHFKAINDSHGHAAGDEVIRVFARILREVAPADAVFGRIGGEEFAIVLPNSGFAEAQAIVDRVRAGLQSTLFAGDAGPFRASASCGLAVAEAREPLKQVMMRCDRALYRAKAEGRDRTVMAS